MPFCRKRILWRMQIARPCACSIEQLPSLCVRKDPESALGFPRRTKAVKHSRVHGHLVSRREK